jgi:hypothetical protein
MDQPELFLVVLGGRTRGSHIEQHDVRFVAGHSIDDTLPQLRQQWFGQPKGLHLDSYVALRFVDGFRIRLQSGPVATADRLFFVNLGAYAPSQLMELHQFGLVVARSPRSAVAKGKARWLRGFEQRHKDDLVALQTLPSADDCLVIERVDDWHVHLEPDPEGRHQPLVPDWFGYRRIDRI